MVIHLDFAIDTVAYVFDGPMTDQKINELRIDILQKLEKHDQINIYLEDQGIEHFTMYSVLQGIIFPLQNSNRFNRVAMVTNRNWIHMLSSINQIFMTGSIKNFTTEERVHAMQWVATGSPEEESTLSVSPLKKIAPSDFVFEKNTLAYLVEGSMDKASIARLKTTILNKLEYHEKINLYLEDRAIDRFSISAATITAFFPLEYASRFHKIALVTDRKWIHTIAAIDNLFIKTSLKYYPKDKRALAMSWIADD